MGYVRQVNVGQEYLRRGRRWVVLGFEPYTRKDGAETELAVWQGCCVKCNGAFNVKSPRTLVLEYSNSFGAARCPACRAKGRK